MSIPAWVKPGAWGVVIGAFAWWAVLAFGFGWVSPGTARQRAENETQAAVVAAAAPDCVARFEHQANAVSSWKALQKSAADYDQNTYLEKGGWVVLPKQGPAAGMDDAVADSCATQLLALKQLDGVKLSSLK